MQQYYNSIAQGTHNTQYSYPRTRINSYSSRLSHSPFTIFRTMFQRNGLTQCKMNNKLFETLSS